MCRWTQSRRMTASTPSTVENLLYHRRQLQIALRNTSHDSTYDEHNHEYQNQIRAFVHGRQQLSEGYS